MAREDWGLIDPLPSLAEVPAGELHTHLGIKIPGGYRAYLWGLRGANSVFDDIATRTRLSDTTYEDQCSAKYYFDLFNAVRTAFGEITRVVEVGVYMGGASVILAGCAARMGLELDLVDINQSFLRFSHERIRRTFPEAVPRVRMFHGDLPTYVRDVLGKESAARVMVQHDGSHDFNQVVRDLASLSFVRGQFHSLAIQDTHLRGIPPYMNFVDAAVYAIFGFDLAFSPMGTTHHVDDTAVTTPNKYEGNYFLPDRPEGMYLSMDNNQFFYPHPTISLDAFLPKG